MLAEARITIAKVIQLPTIFRRCIGQILTDYMRKFIEEHEREVLLILGNYAWGYKVVAA